MYQNILVPLDGSDRAEMILPHVKDVATHYSAKVVFLKVDEEPVMLGRDEVVDTKKSNAEFEKRREQTEAYLAARKKEFREEGITADTKVAFGPVVKAILSTADEENADLIAMASHGLSAVPRTSYGSVAAGLLQHIKRPLFVIRSAD